eukprot:m.130408 g.130408  ORF g.130408 m.130408 type:complete len:277 (+) comp29475_c0_seq1:229-1059(+)
MTQLSLLVIAGAVSSAFGTPTPCTECFVGYSGARVEELCAHDGVTCDESSCSSPYVVNYGPDAVACDPTLTPYVQDAIANGMFGLKNYFQPTDRDCSAWCLWDLSSPNKGAYKRHFRWKNSAQCWEKKNGHKCTGNQDGEQANALAHFDVQCQEPAASCSTYQGVEYCCDRGFTKYGDGSACRDCKNQQNCAMWGNAALPRCTESAPVPTTQAPVTNTNGQACSDKGTTGLTFCCDIGQVPYGDGSACTGNSQPNCAMWGNAALPRCTECDTCVDG